MDPLVLVPGLGSDGAVWARTVAALGPTIDTRIGDTLSDDSLVGMAARILAAAPDRFALAGVSMGGMVALEIMRVAPARVTRLALIDTRVRPDSPDERQRREQANAAVAATTDYRALAAGSLGYLLHPAAPADVRAAMVEMSVRVGPAAYVRQNDAVAARADARPGLAAIAVPTIVVVGADDRLTPPEQSREIAAAIPGAALHVIPDCGHLPPIEAPAALAALLRAWLA